MYGIVLSSLMLCTIPQSETMNNIRAYALCLNNNKKIENVVEWTKEVSLHFEEEDVREALLIIYCESSGNPKAININKDNSRDVGLFQFWDNTWYWLKNKLKFNGKRTTPSLNIKVASWLYYNSGSHHWNSSRNCWEENIIYEW